MKPKIYSIEEHQITPEKVDQHAYYVIQKLKQAGFTAYLVGGGVRDLLLKQRPKDFDVSTSAKPEEIRALFRNAILIGRRFRLAHIRFGKKIIEVATFRAGETETADLIVRDNVWGDEMQDALRRDFTINGLFYDPEKQVVIDYVGGYADLEKRLLRTIGQPETRFIQDPVRMIRLIKFCARFNFDLDPSTYQALLNCKEEIVKSAPARILEELLRMLESGSSKPFFHLLHEYGLLQSLLPFLEQRKEFLHLLEEADNENRKTPNEPLDRSLLLSTLLFPILDSELQREAKERALHLGHIAEISSNLIDQTFDPFFLLPRRFRGTMTFLLTQQYRILPLDQRVVRRPRPPKDSLFRLALQLFKIRCGVQPELLSHYTRWTEASFTMHEEHPPSQEPKRRRRRRRPHKKPPT